MRQSCLNISFLTLLAIGGCSQIIGLSDYEVDPKLGSAGETSSEGGEPAHGGNQSTAGKPTTQGGDDTGGTTAGGDNVGQGGEPVGPGGAPTMMGSAGEAGAPPITGTLVPCDSTTCCTDKGGQGVGVELLKDGGFELGTVDDGATPWTENSAKGYALITDGVAEKADPHKGTYFAFLAGVTNETSDLQSETFKVPADAGWVVISGYRFFQLDSEPTDTMNADFLSIGLYQPSVKDPLELPFLWDNTDPGASVNYVKFSAEFSAQPHVGQSRYLMLRGKTDAHGTDTSLTASNYMLDDLSVKIFRCYK